MQIDQFLDLAKKRRSIRKFKPDPIPDEYIEKILEAARWAMSGANSQPWEFIVIKDKVTIKQLNEALARHRREMTMVVESSRLPEYRQPHYQAQPKAEQPLDIMWGDAPIMIAVLGDMRTMQASTLTMRFFEHHTFDQNMANAIQMMHLAAAALGLGARWISLDEPLIEEMKPLLGVPPVIKLFALTAIGYPAHQPTPFRRKLSEFIHYEKYDMSKFRSQTDIQEFIKYLRRTASDNFPGS